MLHAHTVLCEVEFGNTNASAPSSSSVTVAVWSWLFQRQGGKWRQEAKDIVGLAVAFLFAVLHFLQVRAHAGFYFIDLGTLFHMPSQVGGVCPNLVDFIVEVRGCS